MKKYLSYMLAFSSLFTLVGCQSSGEKEKAEHSMALMTDAGGVNDGSFNQSAWEGAQKVKAELGFDIRYLESKQSSDYKTNLDILDDGNPDIIFGLGNTVADPIAEQATLNPKQHYVAVDHSYEDPLSNVLGVDFKDSEPSFLMGYLAGYKTESNKVGFIGGVNCLIIDEFKYGFLAGVHYAGKEINKEIQVDVQYIENFQDETKGKAIASGMYARGIDVIYVAAGNAAKGVIQAAVEKGKFVIGSDRDQEGSAPKSVLGSSLKLTNMVVWNICKQINDGVALDEITGKNWRMTLKDGAVDIVVSKTLVDQNLRDKIEALKQQIISGEITTPDDEAEYDDFMDHLRFSK